MLGYCPWTLSVPRSSQLRSQKTVRFSEQIMSADKYPSIFSRQMEAIVYISKTVMNAGANIHRFSLTDSTFIPNGLGIYRMVNPRLCETARPLFKNPSARLFL